MSEYQFRVVPDNEWYTIEAANNIQSNMPIPGIDLAGLMFFDSPAGTQSAALIDAMRNSYLVQIRHDNRSATVFPTELKLMWMLDNHGQRRLWLYFIGRTRMSVTAP